MKMLRDGVTPGKLREYHKKRYLRRAEYLSKWFPPSKMEKRDLSHYTFITKIISEGYKMECTNTIKSTVLSKGHGRLTNHEWIDFLTEQFDISRTSAKEMLHAMMAVKKEDNFKKQFSQRKESFSQGFSQG